VNNKIAIMVDDIIDDVKNTCNAARVSRHPIYVPEADIMYLIRHCLFLNCSEHRAVWMGRGVGDAGGGGGGIVT
jgi:hypothetical protein